MWSAPKVKKGKKEEPIEKFKSVKCRVSGASAKALLERKEGSLHCSWVERWLENLVREQSLPPQIVGEGLGGLRRFLAPTQVDEILLRIQRDFAALCPIEVPQTPQSVPVHSFPLVSPLHTLRTEPEIRPAPTPEQKATPLEVGHTLPVCISKGRGATYVRHEGGTFQLIETDLVLNTGSQKSDVPLTALPIQSKNPLCSTLTRSMKLTL